MADQAAAEKITCQVHGHAVDLLFLAAIRPFGNKYYKLKHNLTWARDQGYTTIASFGGAWSNHLHALAQVGAEQGFKTIGIVRGERAERLSMTLLDCEARGMQLHFISREDYRRRHSLEFLRSLRRRFADCYLIPEGGTNQLAVQGAGEIVAEINRLSPAAQLILLPVATGGTLAGIAAALPAEKRVLGISVLKGTGFASQSGRIQGAGLEAGGLEAEVAGWIGAQGLSPTADRNWAIDHRFHCGGYARCPDYLQAFILDWQAREGVLLDPVYTGKLFYGLSQMLQQGEIDSNTAIVALHTGGEQGRRGYDFLNISALN